MSRHVPADEAAAARPGMSIVRRSVHALAAASLIVSMVLAAMPASATALQPPRPLPGYHPRFVTETDERPWNDCLWASGAMLIEKWTNGRIHPTHQRLRRLSGDLVKGSGLDDLKVAFRKLGVNLKFSPDGGDPITFRGLLRRLAHGAGAVVLGDDSRLPRWYGRWDYGFWHMTRKERKKHPSHDNHALYVERYDRRHHRVWVMDPLARGNWKGEWMSSWALSRFIWSRGGKVFAAVTPTAKPAPFSGVRVGALTLTQSPTTLDASWAIRAPRRWRFPGADTHTSFARSSDALLAAARSPRVEILHNDEQAPRRPTTSGTARAIVSRVALPSKPGAYVASVRLTDRRFGRTPASTSGVAVFVPGARRANLRLSVPDDPVVAGANVPISVSVGNSGDLTWADPTHGPDDGSEAVPDRNTRLVARWIPLDASGAADAPAPVELEALPLDAGRVAVVEARLHAPDAPGRWALAVDVVDDVDGSFAALGSAPSVAALDVVPPSGPDIAN